MHDEGIMTKAWISKFLNFTIYTMREMLRIQNLLDATSITILNRYANNKARQEHSRGELVGLSTHQWYHQYQNKTACKD